MTDKTGKTNGWWADDGTGPAFFSDAESASEAAQEYVTGANCANGLASTMTKVLCCPYSEDGDYTRITTVDVIIPPTEPPCTEDKHDWQSPINVVGGISESPGVYGHGGGVTITEVCSHCGWYRVQDTWADDGYGGHYDATEYREPDSASLEWVESVSDDDDDEGYIDD